jgi:hypothetical protein
MTQPAVNLADDLFERHYEEKIWALIPEIYRSEDGAPTSDGPLRGLVRILAEQAAIARRSIDKVWADSRIDEADDWAVPYIGALLATRPVSRLNRAGQRVNVERTIHYRRRLGTVRLAELLADDIADWDAVANEGFRRLFRHWHMLDGGPQPGAITRTPQWGYADLRATRIDAVPDHAHDDVSHYADMRRHRGVLGRYNIPKVNLHLFRQYAYPLTGVTPVEVAPQLYTLDPSGRDVPLFQPGASPDRDCFAAREWEMRAPIPCRRLNFAGFSPRPEHAPVGLTQLLGPIYGRRFATVAGLLEAANAALANDPAPPDTLTAVQAEHLVTAAMEHASPRFNLLPGGDPATLAIALAVGADAEAAPFGPAELVGANLAHWGADLAPEDWIDALVDPRRGRVRLMDAVPADREFFVQRIYYGTFWPIGAGTHPRGSALAAAGFTPINTLTPDFTVPLSGELRFVDNRTYRPQLPANGVIEADGSLSLTAEDGVRPYVVFERAGDATVTIRSSAADADLLIDGLWIGLATDLATGVAHLRIDGQWRNVTIRNTTIDPGGRSAAPEGQPPGVIPAVIIDFAGSIERIEIDRSVTGRLVELQTALDPCATNRVVIADSILRARTNAPAVRLRNASLTVDRTTVFGDVVCGRIDASNILVAGQVLAEDQQEGCFRFSAALSGGRVPHPYESQFFAGRLPAGTFVSKRFGDPGFAAIGETAPEAIRSGGEGGIEMGAFARALDPIKRADLENKLAEFMPVNAIVQLIVET